MSEEKKNAYLGNMNLKRSNVDVEYTQEEMQEFIKCAQDPIYFFETETSGEKTYEEFYTESEDYIIDE